MGRRLLPPPFFFAMGTMRRDDLPSPPALGHFKCISMTLAPLCRALVVAGVLLLALPVLPAAGADDEPAPADPAAEAAEAPDAAAPDAADATDDAAAQEGKPRR